MPVKKPTTKRTRKSTTRPAATVRARKTSTATGPWLVAVNAGLEKKASDVRVLDLRPVTTFADYMIVCSGSNPRQIQTIADEVELKLKAVGERPKSVEGYQNAEWILMDYGDYVVNIFSQKARAYYDLERLWQDAPVVALPESTLAL